MKSKLMTKLALVAAVACAAGGSARADFLYWTVDGVQATHANQYVGYLFADTTSTAESTYGKTATLDFIKSALNAGTDVSSYAWFTAKNSYDSGKGTGSFSFGQAWIGSYYMANTFAVILNSDSISTASGYMVATKDGNEIYKYTGSNLNNQYTLAFDNASSAIWNIVPEPTSGVLLLVGVAALALRRKKAA